MSTPFPHMSQAQLDEMFSWGSTAPATPTLKEPKRDVVRITYEVASNEPVHPDPSIAARMTEIGISDCGYGCKVYADPLSAVRVLAHNRSYGCPR